MKDVLLDAVEVKGNHSGNNIAKHLVKICDTYGVREKIFCITADSATSNKTMASSLSSFIPDFRMSQHLLGCASHVFNLAAKEGISAVEKSTEEYLTEIGLDSTMSEVEVNEDSDSDYETVSSTSILHRIRDIVKSIRRSPQKRQKFEIVHKLRQDQLAEQSAATRDSQSASPSTAV